MKVTRWDEFDAEARWLKVGEWHVRIGRGTWSAVCVAGDRVQRLSGQGEEKEARAAIAIAEAN